MLVATAATLAVPALFILHPLIGAYTTVAIATLAILGWLVLRRLPTSSGALATSDGSTGGRVAPVPIC
jgi:hypothetical protein